MPTILTTRPAAQGHWEILCPPGALSQFLASLAHQTTYREQIDGHQVEIITLTPDLDIAITQLIETLTDIRYQTGRVQLELFNTRHIL